MKQSFLTERCCSKQTRYLIDQAPFHCYLCLLLLKPQAHLSSHEFISLFDTIDGNQSKQYIDKAIEIKGVLKKVTKREDRYTFFIDSDEEGRFIQCEMQIDQNQKVQSIQTNAIITVKGIFKGVLLDAILLNCILID